MNVTLTIGELHLAAQIGALRQIESLSKGLKDKHGFEGYNGWTIHIEGAAGEIAAAKALNLYWGGTVNTFKTIGDIGKLEIRTSKGNSLIVRNADKNDSIFILVTGKSPNYEVVGWIKGENAKQEKWLKAPGGRPPAYFVPIYALNDLKSLDEHF